MMIAWTDTNRGFRFGDFKDYYGKSCSIQESSLAGKAAIWLGQDEVGGEPARMHLTQDMAATLVRMLQHFVDTGELPK